MHLVDTNVWLERLLDQARAKRSASFLSEFPRINYSSLISLSIQLVWC